MCAGAMIERAMPEPIVEERARARVGQTLHGKYRLDRLLGVGGMASVYAATHRNKKRVAVKMLHAELSVHEGLRARFMREGYLANTVEHPGAVAVLDDDVAEDGAAYLVMELLEGGTLDDLSDRQGGRLPLRVVLAVAEQMLDVLAAADAKHIVHRDIKPSNVFVTKQGQVKVLDFGVARLRDAEGAHATHSGVALGTPAFMAPEQALGRSEEISGRTDVWAVGATMLSLLTGRSVHQASSAQEQMVLAATRPPPSLATFDPETPPSVVTLVDRALAFEQTARWQTAAEMRDAVRVAARALFPEPLAASVLGGLAAECGPVVTGDSPSDPLAATVAAPAGASAPPPPRRPPGQSTAPAQLSSLAGTAAQTAPSSVTRGRAMAGAVLLVLAGAGVGAWIALRSRGEPATTAASASSLPPTVGSTEPVASAAPSVGAVTASAAPSTASSPSSTEAMASAAASPGTRPRTGPKPAPTAAPSKPAPDRFDRQ